MIPSSELLKVISDRHPEVVRAPDELNDTARTWKIPGYTGNFGFISSMSDHFVTFFLSRTKYENQHSFSVQHVTDSESPPMGK